MKHRAKGRASVRVIETPKPPEPKPPEPMRSRCKCGALLEFDAGAVQYGPEHQIDGRDAFVRCPHCKADHHLNPANVEPFQPVPTCAKCGRRRDRHNVRHPFVATMGGETTHTLQRKG